jgi:hypothetical protein
MTTKLGNGMADYDINQLQGWYLKKKSRGGINFFTSSGSRRWFKVASIKVGKRVELAICYYINQRSKNIRGWIFLNDITEISDDQKSFKITSPSRSFTIFTTTPAELKTWLRGLKILCSKAKFELQCNDYIEINLNLIFVMYV